MLPIRSHFLITVLPETEQPGQCGVRSAECGVRSAECGVRSSSLPTNMPSSKFESTQGHISAHFRSSGWLTHSSFLPFHVALRPFCYENRVNPSFRRICYTRVLVGNVEVGGVRSAECGVRKSDIGDRRSEVGDWRLETSQPASNNEQRTTNN